MSNYDYLKLRPYLRRAIALVLVLGLATCAYFEWRGSVEAQLRRKSETAEREKHLKTLERKKKAKVDLLVELASDKSSAEKQFDYAIRPVDEYFDVVAIPHIHDFLSDFSGLFYDTPRFVYKWLADKIGFRGYSSRVNDQVKQSLVEHLGFPDKFTTAVQESLARFRTLQQQHDAEVRERTYLVLQGAGANLDQRTWDTLLSESRMSAEKFVFETAARDSAINFGAATAGKEVAMVAIQSLIIERVMVAVATRLGIVVVGTNSAGATAAGGTATGVLAVPSYVLTAAEIALTVVVDLAFGWMLESKAENAMREQLTDVKSETRAQLRDFMKKCDQRLQAERTELVNKLLPLENDQR